MIAAVVLAAIGIILLFATISAIAHIIGWVFIAAAVIALVFWLLGVSRSRVQ